LVDLKLQMTPEPRYLTVKNYILAGIRAGRWLPADKIPSENELTDLCGVSRMTAKRALDELSQEGIVERTKGLGTFVSQRKPMSSLLKIRDISEDIVLRGHQHQVNVLNLEERILKAHYCSDLQGLNSALDEQKVYYSEILHFENQIPVQLEQRYINPKLAPDYLQQNFNSLSPTHYLLAHIPVTKAQQSVEAVIAPVAINQILQMEQTLPCLVLHRRTWSGNTWATINTFYYPGHRYQFESDIPLNDFPLNKERT